MLSTTFVLTGMKTPTSTLRQRKGRAPRPHQVITSYHHMTTFIRLGEVWGQSERRSQGRGIWVWGRESGVGVLRGGVLRSGEGALVVGWKGSLGSGGSQGQGGGGACDDHADMTRLHRARPKKHQCVNRWFWAGDLT